MNFDAVKPPVNLIADFQALQLTIADDRSGDKARQMVDYLKTSELKCQEIGLHSTDFEEKQFARMLSEAFDAAGRIVLSAWRKANDSDLLV